MSASHSHLSASGFGYGIVVATTQGGINVTMKEFLAGLPEPEVEICFTADADGNPVRTDCETVMSMAKGTDPFAVPHDADPVADPRIADLKAARFMAGFKARIGLPPGYEDDLEHIPDLVTLPPATGPVTFRLLCSRFQIVELVPGGGYSPPAWTNVSQPVDENAWVFSSEIDLDLSTVPQSDYGKLPKAVQERIKDLDANAFGVRQLLFDLANARLSSTLPRIAGVKPGTKVYDLLTRYFVDDYFARMRKHGRPLLGVTVTRKQAPASTLTVTDLNLMNNPYMGINGCPAPFPTRAQRNAATLNYLCAVDGALLPPPRNFTWNWIDAPDPDAGGCHGVIAVNRNEFVKYFSSELAPYVAQNCFKSSVSVKLEGLDVVYTYGMTPGQAPAVQRPESGSTILSFSHAAYAHDQAGLGGDMGEMHLNPSFNLHVELLDNTIRISQHLQVYCKVSSLGTSAGGFIIDYELTDVYTLAVTEYGELTCSAPESTRKDNSEHPSRSGFLNFFTGIDNLVVDVSNWAASIAPTGFTDIPVSTIRDIVFPGGKTFAFKKARFSLNQDLIAYVTYVDPD